MKANKCLVCGNGIPQPKRGPVGKTCGSKCRVKLHREKATQGHAQPRQRDETGFTPVEHQKTCYNPSGGAYTSSSIIVLSNTEVRSDSRFDWEWAQELAQEFRRDPEWIDRGIRACREAGADPQYFIDRYLHHEPIPMNHDVDRVFREIFWGANRQGLTATSSATM
jgi:hypothetical protein